MSRLPHYGNGDPCPTGLHGAMFMFKSGRQFCPHSYHGPGAIYEYDGVTPAPRPAADPGAHRPAAERGAAEAAPSPLSGATLPPRAAAGLAE